MTTRPPSEAQDRFEGSTPGPWSWFNAWPIAPGEVACLYLGQSDSGKKIVRSTDDADIRLSKADAELIAAAPTLAAENERLRRALGKIKWDSRPPFHHSGDALASLNSIYETACAALAGREEGK